MLYKSNRDYLAGYDVIKSNPNGDKAKGDMPRQNDQTREGEVSDFRIKRFYRDYWIKEGLQIFGKRYMGENGKVYACADHVEKWAKDSEIVWNADNKMKKIEKEILEKSLCENFIDMSLFGFSITKPMISHNGPIRIQWGNSIHEIRPIEHQGIASYASGEDKEQATTWSAWKIPYGFYIFDASYDFADGQSSDVTDEKLKKFVTDFFPALRSYRSTSKFQMPRFMLEIIYKEGVVGRSCISELLDFEFSCEEKIPSKITQIIFDFSRIGEYCEKWKDKIVEINFLKDDITKCINIPEVWNVKEA